MIKLTNHQNKTMHSSQLEGDVKISQADMCLSNKILDWNHEINLIDGLRELIENYLPSKL